MEAPLTPETLVEDNAVIAGRSAKLLIDAPRLSTVWMIAEPVVPAIQAQPVGMWRIRAFLIVGFLSTPELHRLRMPELTEHWSAGGFFRAKGTSMKAAGYQLAVALGEYAHKQHNWFRFSLI